MPNVHYLTTINYISETSWFLLVHEAQIHCNHDLSVFFFFFFFFLILGYGLAKCLQPLAVAVDRVLLFR